ncbi:MAG: hypothetical protein ACT4QF_12465 [Sporichthyaceae bacterium]
MGIGLASPASAAPYTCQIEVGVVLGGDVRQVNVVVNCAIPGELVAISVITSLSDGPIAAAQTRQVATLRADAKGVARGTVDLPSNSSCQTRIKAEGQKSKRVAYTDIYVEPCDSQNPTASAAEVRSGERSITLDPASIAPAPEQGSLLDATGIVSRPGVAAPAASDQQQVKLLSSEIPAGPTGGPISSTAAATGFGLVFAAAAAGVVISRRREGRNNF